ncbi:MULTISPECIES: PH domain-containing protein [Oceanobacillus]|uniref:PH domain-containing protein n=1 Tax=Oceanobacillus aidingensis TaxID=645964 RepID=A0ABV9K2E8_9BACI|nr:PH domain-containing protein [Oceanobacillus oncorhynchi]MDM8100493.1 PH domain-containing protein [Oceanobacillus oncorhynchi]UUI42238.1 PH domain-containing protein [Oceanobacillus oncorhynchi]
MGILDGLMGNASNVDEKEIMKEYEQLFIEGEEVSAAFKVIRDLFIFTNKRLILVDKQGLTGKKTEYHSILYKSISHFSVETAGHFDMDAELKIWISGGVNPLVSKTFKKDTNIYDIQKVLASVVV